MIPVEITDYLDRAIGLLLAQFKDKANFQNFLSVVMTEIQEIETVGFQLFTLRRLDTSQGVQLDALGDLFGQSRNGLSDADFRALVRIRIYELTSSGTNPELLTVLKALTAAETVLWWNDFPAGIGLLSDGEDIPKDLFPGMLRLTPAGVALWIYLTYGTSLPLGFAPEKILGGVVEMEGGGVSLDGGFVLSYDLESPAADIEAGTFCDIDPENTIIPYENSGRMIDVLQEA